MEQDSASLLKEGANSVLIVTADVTKVEEVKGMVEKVTKTYGGIDCFFNNAGIQGELQPLHKQSVEMFQRTLQVNALGVFLGMKYVSLAMIEANKGGVIVNTSSLAGLQGPPNMAAYAASKFAVSGLTRTGAKDLAQYGIRVCAIAPGLLEGKMWDSQIKGQALVRREIEGLFVVNLYSGTSVFRAPLGPMLPVLITEVSSIQRYLCYRLVKFGTRMSVLIIEVSSL